MPSRWPLAGRGSRYPSRGAWLPPPPGGSPLPTSPPRGPLPATAGAEREDGVTRRGARGPGRGAGESQPERAREVRARAGRGGRRALGGEPSGAGSRGGPAPASPSRLLAASETAHFASRLWTAAGRVPHPRSEGAPRTWSHPAPASPLGARAPPGGTAIPPWRGHPGLCGGTSRSRGAAALSLGRRQRGAELTPRGLRGHLQVPRRGGSVSRSDAGQPGRREPRGPRVGVEQKRSARRSGPDRARAPTARSWVGPRPADPARRRPRASGLRGGQP